MKKNYFFLALLLGSGLFSKAQPVLTSADFTDYSEIAHNVPDLTGVTVGNSGANQTWNYGALIPSSTLSPDAYLSTVPVNLAPYYYYFPLANNCQKIYYTYNNTLYENYSFSKISSTGIETFGSSNSSGVTIQYTDTQFIPLPLHYTDNYIDTYDSTATGAASSNNTYDAYGTLTTPYGTYSNVVRIKQIRATSTAYSWAKTNPYLPLMVIRVDNTTGNVNSVTVYQNTTLGMNENEIDNSIKMYPNPTKNIVNITGQNPIKSIQLFDVNGRVLMTKVGNELQINISLSDYAKGIYFLKVTSEKGMKTEKIVKE